MVFVYWYLCIGVSLFIGIFLFNAFFRTDAAQDIKDQWFGKGIVGFLKNLAMLSAGIPFVAVSWPYFIYLELQEKYFPKHVVERKTGLQLTRADLKMKVSREDVEIEEMVFDPLGAVPNLPFGHLNPVWVSFIQDLDSNDELWKFEFKEKLLFGGIVCTSGYAILRRGSIESHWQTMRSESYPGQNEN